MGEIAREAIGNVDGRSREAAQPLAECDARFGLVQARKHRIGIRAFEPCAPELVHEPERRTTELARHPDLVAGLRACAVQRKTGRHFPHDRD